MAVDPSLSFAYKGIEVPNQLAQYTQLAQLQNMQQAGELNALKMQEMRALNEEKNALRQLNPSAADYESQLFKVNPALGIQYRKEKTAAEQAAATTQKTKLDIATKTAEEYRGLLQHVRTPEQAAQWVQSQYANPYLAPVVNQVPIEQALGGIPTDPKQLSSWVNQNALGMTEWVKRNTMTAAEKAADARAREKMAQDERSVVYQQDAEGNVIALPSKLRAGEIPRARMAAAAGSGMTPLEGKPSEAVSKERLSIGQQRAIVKGALDAVTSTPDAFGMSRGLMPEALGGRLASSEENQARSYLFNVVSGVIKERAGTAQSAAEADTLRRFLPVETDDANVIKDKMQAFDKYLVAKESGTGRQPKKETPSKTVLRTGTFNNRKVVEYSDGSVEYAD